MEKQKSNVILVFVLAIVSLVSLTFSVSYSYILRASSSSSSQKITTGSIDSQVTYTATEFNLSSMSDSAGMAQTNYGIMNVTKTSSYSEYYQISISYSSTIGDILPAEYIHLALYDIDASGNLSASPVAGPVIMADLPVYTTDSSDPLNTSYLLTNGFYESTANTSHKYALKAWLSENTPDDYVEYLIDLKLGVHEETKVSKQLYNVTFNYSALSGTSYKMTILNGAFSSTSSTGVFSFTNVPVGTYNLKVLNTSSESVVLDEMIRLESGASKSVSKTTATSDNQIVASSGTSLQASALTYYQTAYRIKQQNQNIKDTNTAPASSYVVPFSYKITGLPSLDVTTITVNITNSSGNITMSLGS